MKTLPHIGILLLLLLGALMTGKSIAASQEQPHVVTVDIRLNSLRQYLKPTLQETPHLHKEKSVTLHLGEQLLVKIDNDAHYACYGDLNEETQRKLRLLMDSDHENQGLVLSEQANYDPPFFSFIPWSPYYLLYWPQSGQWFYEATLPADHTSDSIPIPGVPIHEITKTVKGIIKPSYATLMEQGAEGESSVVEQISNNKEGIRFVAKQRGDKDVIISFSCDASPSEILLEPEIHVTVVD